jgi:hypothetical protein
VIPIISVIPAQTEKSKQGKGGKKRKKLRNKGVFGGNFENGAVSDR